MRVLILVDARFAIHERSLIERMIVALANEGVAAQVVLPKDRGLEEHGFDLLAEPVWYADRGLSMTQNIRARQVARQVVGDSNSSDNKVDIVHVFGGAAWSMGRELARVLDAGVVLEVWRAGMTDPAKAISIDETDRVLFLVPERSFESRLVDAGFASRVHVAPWGAHVSTDPVQIFREGKTIAIVLMSSGRQREQCIAAFEGIVDAMESNEDSMLFVNLEMVERTDLWARVQRRGIEDRFTIIDRSEDRRDLLLRCDMMVYPDTLHEERTLLLDAMGAGMAVIAGNDEDIAPIQESEGVYIVDRPTRAAWSEILIECLSNPDRTRIAGEKSREYVKGNRRVASSIASVIDAYTGLCSQPASIETES